MSTLTSAPAVPLLTAIRRFAMHFIEMCLVMCGGGAVLNLASFGLAAVLGRSSLVAEAPELSILIITVDLALAMAAYMALRGHPVRHNIEMSGSTFVGGLAFMVLASFGALRPATLASWPSLFAFMCGPLCLLMLMVMLVRFDHYGGRVGVSTAKATSSVAGEYSCSMHPEVRRTGPGRCPICGMTLARRQS